MEYLFVLLWIAGGSGQTGGANTPHSLLQRLAVLTGLYGEGTTESTPNSTIATGRTNAGLEPMLICGIREGLTKGAILPKSISARWTCKIHIGLVHGLRKSAPGGRLHL